MLETDGNSVYHITATALGVKPLDCCTQAFVGDLLSLEPLDGGRRVSDGLAWQHDVLHPGSGHCSIERQDPGWSCNTHRQTKQTHQESNEVHKSLWLIKNNLILLTNTKHSIPLYT